MHDYRPVIDSISEQTGVEFRPALTSDLLELEQLGLPESITGFYRFFEPGNCVELQARLWPIEHILEENKSLSPGFYTSKHGYIVFATNFCGDTFCFNLKSGNDPAVVFISHEEVCQETSKDEIAKVAEVVTDNFLEFLSQFARQEIAKKFI